MAKEGTKRLSVLIAHSDPAWVDRVKAPLEKLGFEVTVCPEPSWAVDLLSGSRPFHLAAVSSEIDPTTQADILRAIKSRRHAPKIMFLLDDLDTASMHYRGDNDLLLTHRLSADANKFVQAVVDQLGLPTPPAF